MRPGYPVTEQFKSIEDVRDYLSGDSVVCLICGKPCKSLGLHLRVHDITPDEYREMYRIPWTYGLVCSDTKVRYGEQTKRRIANGEKPPCKIGEEQTRMIQTPKRQEFFKREVAIKNLGEHTDPKYPLLLNDNGELETKTQRRIRLKVKRGTSAHQEKMKKRPQCDPLVVGERFRNYWSGRKQSEEHVANKTSSRKKTDQPL